MQIRNPLGSPVTSTEIQQVRFSQKNKREDWQPSRQQTYPSEFWHLMNRLSVPYSCSVEGSVFVFWTHFRFFGQGEISFLRSHNKRSEISSLAPLQALTFGFEVGVDVTLRKYSRTPSYGQGPPCLFINST